MTTTRLENYERGYTFDNYQAPDDEWGVVFTADDMRYTYLAGIELTLTDGREVKDKQLSKFVELAVAEFEAHLGIVIRKRIYRTNYKGDERRSPKYKTIEDLWTHEDSSYPFLEREWRNQGTLKLNHRPIISVERCILKTPTDGTLIDLSGNNWVRLSNKSGGLLHMYPRQGMTYPIYGPYLGAYGLILNRMKGDYFDAIEVDYTTGYESSDFVPDSLRQVIGELAAVGLLNWIGDGLLSGFSSSSVSLDSVSESFSSTQSATSIDGRSRVLFEGKLIPIRHMYENKSMFVGKQIISKNRQTGKEELKTLQNVLKHNCQKKRGFVIKVRAGNSIIITEDHSLFTDNLKEVAGRDLNLNTILALRNKGSVVESLHEIYINDMYDLCVEDNENFIAEDFVCHNSSYFGARILSYTNAIKEWLKKNRYKFNNMPFAVA